ncbi:MAG: TetR/AcrR family transcriptional regulator [Pseudomonadales bacterium]
MSNLASTSNKHASNSALTRERLISAALELFAERTIGAVSLNEITTRAGQKNRNALQYHFGNRQGLVQAVVDKYSSRVSDIRSEFISQFETAEMSPAEMAASALIRPIIDYVSHNVEGVHFVQVISQIATTNAPARPKAPSYELHFPDDPKFTRLINEALHHLPAAEAHRRIFLAVSMVFHSIADIYRSAESDDTPQVLSARKEMVEQLVLAIESFFQAAPRQAG